MRYTEAELKERYANLRDIVANQRLEGYEISSETREDLEKVVLGQITSEEALKNILQRIKRWAVNKD